MRRKVLEGRRKELLSQSVLKASLEERVRKAQQTLTSEQTKVQALERELNTLGTVLYDQDAHDLARRRVTELEPLHLALSKAQAKMERLPISKKQMEETVAAIAKEEGEMRSVVQDRKSLNFDPRALQERRKMHEDARSAEEKLAQEIIRAEGEQRRLVSEKEGLQKRALELQEIKAKHGKLMAEQELLNRLSQVMKGFKENVISRIVPTISQVSSDLLTQLTDGKYGGMRLDDDYQMYIYDQGKEHSLERFSGGESDLANLCLRLAISRMIMERSGSQMNFLVLDEIFGSQDQSRKRNILETLGQLQKQFRQIMLITHIDDVKDNVSAVLKVTEKEDGSSTVALEN
jgi:exonuclease SbcC